MKDMLLSARRGLECLLHPEILKVLFVSGLIWTVANKLFGWLLLGPALVVMFRIALKALRGEELDIRRDNAAVLEDLPSSFVAGILFALPFKLWMFLDSASRGVRELQDLAVAQASPGLEQAIQAREALDLLAMPGVPVTASAALLVHFAFHVYAFAVMAERHCGVVEASRRSREIADAAGRGGSRIHGLGRHVLYTSIVLVVMLAVGAWSWTSWILTIVLAPLAVTVLAAWYLQLTTSPAGNSRAGDPMEGSSSQEFGDGA